MDITDPFLDGFNQDAVHQFDDRSIRGGELIKSTFILASAFNFKIFGSIGNQGAEIFNLGNLLFILAVFILKVEKRFILLVINFIIFFIGVDNVAGCGYADIKAHVDDILKLFDLDMVGGLSHGNLEGISGHAQGHGQEPLGRFVG